MTLGVVALGPLSCSMPPEIGYEKSGPLGEVGQPLSFVPNLPFPSGVSSLITQGWNGSWSHSGNLAYGLDFGSLGFGRHVLAVANGTVVYAYDDCAASSPGCNDGWGNAIIVDHGGSEFSKYTHLEPNSIPAAAAVGSSVCRGDFLGTVGSSGNSTGPHIHLQFQNAGGLNAASVPFDRFVETAGVPAEGDTVTSQNVEAAGCGVEPTCDLVIGDAEVVIEEDSPCGKLTGGPLSEAQGHGEHAYFTVQDNPAPDYAEGLNWLLTFAAAGSYELSVYVPSDVTERSPSAEYKVQYGDQSTKLYLDQTAVTDDWLSLGTFSFAAGDGQWVRLGDNFAETEAEGKHIAIDALRLRPSAACECSDPADNQSRACDGGGTQARTCDGCLWSDWSPCDTGAGGDGGSGAHDGLGGAGTGGAGAGASMGIEAADDDEGCGCRAAGTPRSAPTGLAGLLVATAAAVGLRRRRPR